MSVCVICLRCVCMCLSMCMHACVFACLHVPVYVVGVGAHTAVCDDTLDLSVKVVERSPSYLLERCKFICHDKGVALSYH